MEKIFHELGAPHFNGSCNRHALGYYDIGQGCDITSFLNQLKDQLNKHSRIKKINIYSMKRKNNYIFFAITVFGILLSGLGISSLIPASKMYLANKQLSSTVIVIGVILLMVGCVFWKVDKKRLMLHLKNPNYQAVEDKIKHDNPVLSFIKEHHLVLLSTIATITGICLIGSGVLPNPKVFKISYDMKSHNTNTILFMAGVCIFLCGIIIFSLDKVNKNEDAYCINMKNSALSV